MTATPRSATPSGVARKPEYTKRVLLPLKPSEVRAIDAVRGLKPRTVYIRDAALEAVARDLKGIPREKP